MKYRVQVFRNNRWINWLETSSEELAYFVVQARHREGMQAKITTITK